MFDVHSFPRQGIEHGECDFEELRSDTTQVGLPLGLVVTTIIGFLRR